MKKTFIQTQHILLSTLLCCLALVTTVSAQQPAITPTSEDISMVPKNFDWQAFQDEWDMVWNESWGGAQNNTAYSWNGETIIIEPTIVDGGFTDGFGSADYVPQPNQQQLQQQQYLDQPDMDWASGGSWNNNQWNSDQWFYQDDSYQVPQGNSGQSWYDIFQEQTYDINTPIPAAASVSGFSGQAQSYNLDCETRSAVDLAAWFNVNISHSEFLSRLPLSDDPNLGFVGNFNDERGHIPPASYGVYQEPVAALLRQYGLPAIGVTGFSMDDLKRQIASGKPVMVWVVGNTEIGYSVPYTPSNGRTTYVVPYQHTVVVIGYDSTNITVQDGGRQYTRSLYTFEKSWNALNNRAIIVQ